MKKSLFVAIILLAAILLSACGEDEETTDYGVLVERNDCIIGEI